MDETELIKKDIQGGEVSDKESESGNGTANDEENSKEDILGEGSSGKDAEAGSGITNDEENSEEVPLNNIRWTEASIPGKMLDRGFTLLIDYMDPTPIVDMMQQEGFLKFSDCRDINELPLTTEKNRAIINQIHRRGDGGYTSFKRFLTLSKQTILVDYLESIEKDKDTTAIIETLQNGRGIINRWKGVKDELIALYQEYYVKTELSPLTTGTEIHVDDLYVPLQMEETNISQNIPAFPEAILAKGPQNKQQKEVKRYRDMLYDDYQPVNTVFVIADPGVGKTTFCRKLTSVWCNVHTYTDVHKPGTVGQTDSKLTVDKHDEEGIFEETSYTGDETNEDKNGHEESEKENTIEQENVETMKLFDFLFFVSLRHTSDESKIEDMITNQLHIDKSVLKSIINSAELKCLIILDGLDEWSAPQGTAYSPSEIKGFPKTDNVNKCQILVTTRPWKLLFLTQTSKHKQKEININQMKIDNSKRLIKLFLRQAKKNVSSKESDLLLSRFLKEMENKCLSELSASPLVLKLLLCLWLENGKLKTSICQIYGAVVDLLIEHGLNRNKEDTEFSSKMDKIRLRPKPLADCLDHTDFHNLNRFSDILLQLAKLSFDTLFSATENSKLIFRDRDLKLYDLDLQLCSKLGILSQRPVIGKSLLYRERTVAFLHKSFQEFYAALYISYKPDECMNLIREVYSSPDKIFTVSNVFQFVGGICPSVALLLVDHIRNIDTNLDSSRSETDHAREMTSKVVFRIATESLNCGYENLMIKMNYLSVSDQKFLKFLNYVSRTELNGIKIWNVCMTHRQVGYLLTSFSHLRAVELHIGIVCKYECTPASTHTSYDESPVESLTVVCDLNNIYSHAVQRYRYLQELNLSCSLLHTQITYLMTDSRHLRKVDMRSVTCKEDQNCGCYTYERSNSVLMTISNRIISCSCIRRRRIAPISVVSNVQILNIIDGYGMLKHIDRYQRLQDITLQTLKLNHTDIVRLLSDSRDLKKVKFKDITCTADAACGCLSHRMHAPSDQCISYMKNCEVVLGNELFKHIHHYIWLQDLCIVSVNLSHLEITTLLAEAPCLNKVRLKNVNCVAVSECGCLTSSVRKIVKGSCIGVTCSNASLMKMCTMVDVKGVFNHIRFLPDLYELDIGCLDLSHTEITCLLTTSSSLRKVRLDEINCKADRECECPLDSHSRVFLAEICTIEGGSEMFAHIDKYPGLKDLKLHYVQITYEKLTNILDKSPNLQKVSLAGLEYVTNIKHASLQTDCETLNNVQLNSNQVLFILRHWPRTEGMFVIIEDIEICPGTLETFVHEVEKLEQFEILDFTVLEVIESGGDTCVQFEISQRFTLKIKVKTL